MNAHHGVEDVYSELPCDHPYAIEAHNRGLQTQPRVMVAYFLVLWAKIDAKGAVWASPYVITISTSYVKAS